MVAPPSPKRTARRRAGGFALVDVIVGAILLGVALAVVIGLSGSAISAQARGRDLQIAAMLADEQLNLVLARGPDNYSGRFAESGPCEAPFENYRYELKFTGGSLTDPYRVAATISWVSGVTPQSLTIETLVAARTGDEPDPIRMPETPVDRLLQ